MAPMPINTLSFTTQPCTTARWPTFTKLPMVVGAVPYVQWITAPSCILVYLPTQIRLTSPRTTALNHTEQWSPSVTSPTTVAFSAKKQSVPIAGLTPFTGSIKVIIYYLNTCLKNRINPFVGAIGIIRCVMQAPTFFPAHCRFDNQVCNLNNVA